MSVGKRWQRAAAISVVIHGLLLTGSGQLFAGLFPGNAAAEQYIELDLQAQPQPQVAAESLPVTQQPAAPGTPMSQPAVSHRQFVQSVAGPALADAVPAGPAGGGDAGGESEAGPAVAASSASAGGSGASGSGGVSPPSVLNRVEPVYPQSARQAGITGKVVLKVQVLENGAPGSIVLLRSSGSDALDEAAMAAVQQWQFVPARNLATGRVIACVTTIPVSFRLNG